MDLNQFNDLFLGVIDFCFSDLAFLGPGSGGPTVITSRILYAGSLMVQIRESIQGYKIRFQKEDVYILHQQ